MPLSKVKSTRQEKRLNARIKDWDSLRRDGGTDKRKMVGKSCFTKPGSNRK